MALTATTLSGAMTAGATSCIVASATGFAVGKYMKIDSEYMEIQAVAGTKNDVFRGRMGSPAVAHASGAAVVLAADAGLDFKTTGTFLVPHPRRLPARHRHEQPRRPTTSQRRDSQRG